MSGRANQRPLLQAPNQSAMAKKSRSSGPSPGWASGDGSASPDKILTRKRLTLAIPSANQERGERGQSVKSSPKGKSVSTSGPRIRLAGKKVTEIS